MGTAQAKPAPELESQMISARHFERSGSDVGQEPLVTIEELEADVTSLREGVNALSLAITQIFEAGGGNAADPDGNDDNDDDDYYDGSIEAQLKGMTRINQDLILKLTMQLERHAKEVRGGRSQNERLMATVRHLVDVVNKYMAMLILNIRKLKRLISEIDAKQAPSYVKYTKKRHPLYLPSQTGKKQEDLVSDVIHEQQDVDSMLMQLIHTRAQREELEEDMVTVLVFWREYRYIRAVETDQSVLGRIEGNVLAAADSVATGLANLSQKRSSFNKE